ncbi:MAG: DEAD/DEAH box helicase [Planctomycetaceae bacterium]|jgi:SNF2 family DNA or RNA helicase|nr:DEAD/DEAH box helicase [Planctomycetaceae bacterium]
MSNIIEELKEEEENSIPIHSLYFPFPTTPVDLFVTGWNRQLQRSVEISVRSDLLPPEQRVRVMSLPVSSKVRINSRSWFFAVPPDELATDSQTDHAETDNLETDNLETDNSEPDNSEIFEINNSEANNIEAETAETEISETDCSETNNLVTDSQETNPAEPDTDVSGTEESVTNDTELIKDDIETLTRIRVPRDVIKVQDRLSYILQPPIESILHLPTLDLPFEPFPYQRQGIAFLYSAHFAILADEMGLGKTMQAITTIRLLLRTGEIRNVLLVCPKPLLTNWKREFEIWAPEITVHSIDGSPARRKWLWQLPNIPVRLANYELLNRDREYFDCPKGERAPEFDLVVLDESQRIKNKSNATSQAARAIARRRNWALTGTPVENSQEDLVGIFEFLAPGFLESGLKPTDICKVVGEHILRRTKDKVLAELPPKLLRDAVLELTPEQAKTYKMAEDEGVLRLSEAGNSVSIPQVFELIIRLKQICNFDPATGESAKLERLLADLEEVAESGRKAIIFSQWVETLYRLKQHLNRFGIAEYHGKIPSGKRDEMIRCFREDRDIHVILMSYGAGSVGLNLQFAEYVFLFDRWWNPAVEDQAINRAHRIGAAGPVTVTRFISTNTVEERIDRVLQEKRELSELILSGAKGGLNMSSGLNQDELFGLFNLRVPSKLKKTA